MPIDIFLCHLKIHFKDQNNKPFFWAFSQFEAFLIHSCIYKAFTEFLSAGHLFTE